MQYGMPRRQPPIVMLTISWTSMCSAERRLPHPPRRRRAPCARRVLVARRGHGQNGIVESTDAAAGARIAIAGRPVVDQDPRRRAHRHRSDARMRGRAPSRPGGSRRKRSMSETSQERRVTRGRHNRDYCADGQPHGFDVSALPLRNAYVAMRQDRTDRLKGVALYSATSRGRTRAMSATSAHRAGAALRSCSRCRCARSPRAALVLTHQARERTRSAPSTMPRPAP